MMAQTLDASREFGILPDSRLPTRTQFRAADALEPLTPADRLGTNSLCVPA